MSTSQRTRAETGKLAEQLIASRLVEDGFTIVGQNVRVGRLELDVVARRGSLLVVCEVRALTKTYNFEPAETIDPRKCQRVRQATARYLAENNLGRINVRFDAAAVVFDGPNGEPRIEYYEDAF